MMLKWNAKADSTSAMIMWMVTVTAAIILAYWILKSTKPIHIEIKNMDNELEVLQQQISSACTRDKYRWKFNPSLKIGNVMIRNNQVCIDNQKPRAFYYKLSRPEIIDNDLITNTTNLCDNLNKCSPIYFFSDNDLVINGTDVIIKDAMPAEDANPILRCLPLVCDTNASFDVNLQDVVYIEIKQENGTFDVKRYLLE